MSLSSQDRLAAANLVRSLSHSMLQLRREIEDTSTGRGPELDCALWSAWRALEEHVLLMLPMASAQRLPLSLGNLLCTGSPAIAAKLQHLGVTPHPFSLGKDQVNLILRLGPEAFHRAVDAGLEPPREGNVVTSLFEALLPLCAHKAKGAPWREALDAWAEPSHARRICRELLAYAHLKKSTLSAFMADYLATLIEKLVAMAPEESKIALRGAIISDNAFLVMALGLAGAQLPQDYARIGGSPEVRAIADTLASNHGKIALFSEMGSLSQFLDPKRRRKSAYLQSYRLQPSHIPS